MLKFTNTEKTSATFNGASFSLDAPENWASIGDTPTREAIMAWLAEGNTPEPADPIPVPTQAQIAQDQINAIEAKTMMNRAVREGMLAMTEFAAATQKITPDILYQQNAAYKAVKNVDNQIRQLRALL
jgi:hypothetical protein